MPCATSTNNHIIGNCHIMRSTLTLHTAVPQLYNALHPMHIPSGIDVIHTIDGTYTLVDGTITPHPNSKWYSNSFSHYRIEDWSWAVACQSAQALQEFEDDKVARELPWDWILM